mmetsp:Transcript_31558/g.67247  ORF Transcript_31558/g.67247 Transcript_31558/m.67247 type:complete len:244 (-) Transcript_31558:12-743(-)
MHLPRQDQVPHRRDHAPRRASPPLQRGVRPRQASHRHHEPGLRGGVRVQLHVHHPHQHLRPSRQLLHPERARHTRPDSQVLQRQEGRHPLHHLGERHPAEAVHLQPRPRRAHRVGHEGVPLPTPHHPLGRRVRRGAHQGRGVGRGQGDEVRGGGRVRHHQGRRAVQEDGVQQEVEGVQARLRVHEHGGGGAEGGGLVRGELRDGEEVRRSVAACLIRAYYVVGEKGFFNLHFLKTPLKSFFRL